MNRDRNQSNTDPTSARHLIGVEGAADQLGVPVRHIRRLVAERRIPYIKWGSRLHFDPVELDAWIERHRVPSRDVS